MNTHIDYPLNVNLQKDVPVVEDVKEEYEHDDDIDSDDDDDDKEDDAQGL